jgi:two-component system LytT family response regulator
MIRAVVVDDEPLARANLTSLLRRDPEISEIGECGSGQEALTAIRNARPDLLFLDVQMPECDGFDVLELLGSDIPPAVVLVTAYDRYALRAFEAGALDYLLKPFDDARFALALSRAKEKIERRAQETESNEPRKLERIAVKSAGQVRFLRVADIDWVEAADYYSCLHVGGKSHLLRRGIAELERELDEAQFCRTHRSAIVNLNRVRALQFDRDGNHQILLEDGTRLRLSRRYQQDFQARMTAR